MDPNQEIERLRRENTGLRRELEALKKKKSPNLDSCLPTV